MTKYNKDRPRRVINLNGRWQAQLFTGGPGHNAVVCSKEQPVRAHYDPWMNTGRPKEQFTLVAAIAGVEL